MRLFYLRSPKSQKPSHQLSWSHYVGVSLITLGNCYSDVGRREEALSAVGRSLEIYERLAKRNPDAFEPDLAMGFGARGAILVGAGEEEGAYSFLEGIDILGRLFLKSRPFFAAHEIVDKRLQRCL